MCCNCQCNNFNQQNNFGGLAPMGMGMGFSTLGEPFAEENQRKRRLRAFAKISERHGGTSRVTVGAITDVRESFVDYKVYVMLEYPVDDNAGFTGTKTVEGWLEAPDIVGLATLAGRVYGNKTGVIDSRTGKLLEISSEIF